MSENIFLSQYDSKTKILTGKIVAQNISKEESKSIYSMVENSLKEYPDYTDYILDASAPIDVTADSLGYLMKTMSIVKKTAGYMILILREEILQKFMLSNPEMFDYYVVFFNHEDAVKFIMSKR